MQIKAIIFIENKRNYLDNLKVKQVLSSSLFINKIFLLNFILRRFCMQIQNKNFIMKFDEHINENYESVILNKFILIL